MSSGIQAFNEGYVKTVWETGDVITAEKLNNMENGINSSYPKIIDFNSEPVTVGGLYYVTASVPENYDIIEAITSGGLVFHLPEIETYSCPESYLAVTGISEEQNFIFGYVSGGYLGGYDLGSCYISGSTIYVKIYID